LDKARFEQIAEKATDQERITMTVLYNTVQKALKQVNESSTAASINDWRKSESAYNEIENKLWGKYFEPTLANILAVVDYLTAAGYKISKSACYNHKKQGKLKPKDDGTFRISDVDRYAQQMKLPRLDGRAHETAESLMEDKQKADIKKAIAQADHWELKTQIARGLYVPRDSFERELAQRAMIFKADAEAFCRTQAAVIIGLTGGDKEKAPDLIEYMLGSIAGWLSRYAADREFTVPVDVDQALADPGDDKDDDDDE
jgi:hypothetical protein